MANKKRRKRPYQPPSQEGGPLPEAPEAPEADAPVGTGGAPGGGANVERRQRKEEVRAQKEAALKQLRRREALRRIPAVLVVIVVVALGVFLLTSNRDTANAEIDLLLSKAAAAAKTAGCTAVEDVGPYDPESQDALHSEAGALPPVDSYPSVPAASGPHLAIPEPAGVLSKPPAFGGPVHSLEHGGVIIWYAPGAEKSPAFAEIKDFVERNQDHTLLAPYDYPDSGEAGSLPEGKQMAIVAWHRVQTCSDLSLPVIAKFMSQYRSPTIGGGDYIGIAPEQGGTM